LSAFVPRGESSPRHCDHRAHARLSTILPAVETSEGLVRGAVAVAQHAFDDVDAADILAALDRLGDRVAARVRSRRVDAVLAQLHHVLFEEEGFCGAERGYHRPLDSYLNVVLQTRRGLPISLSLIYKAVAERVGLEVQGVDAPFHFLARVRDGERWILVDPYCRGRLMAPQQALDRIHANSRGKIPRSPELLRPATHRGWLARMVRNLHAFFLSRGFRDDCLAMEELRALLE
jgi:regulator of sirC expression with transglutaminase-like and TPR domain